MHIIQDRLEFAIQVFEISIMGHWLENAMPATPQGMTRRDDLEATFSGAFEPILVEAAGFTPNGVPVPEYETRLNYEEMVKSKGKHTTALLVLVKAYAHRASSTTNNFHKSICDIAEDLLCTKATKETAAILGIDIGTIAWEKPQGCGSLFGKGNSMHEDQREFWSKDWYRFSHKHGDDIRFTLDDYKQKPGSKIWIQNASAREEEPFGDGEFFMYVLREASKEWLLVGPTIDPYKYAPIRSEADIKKACDQLLHKTHTMLNQPQKSLTYKGMLCR